jgi:hypothetical protein
MNAKSRRYTFAFVSFLLISILVFPARRTIGENDASATKPLQKPFRAAPKMNWAGGSAAGTNDTTDLMSQLFVPDRATVSPVMAQAGQSGEVQATTQGIAEVRPGEFNGDVRNLRPAPSEPKQEFEGEAPPSIKKRSGGPSIESKPNNVALGAMPSPLQNFAGLSFGDAVTGGTAGAGWPPDINGDVGLSYYIEAVNDAWGIYNKTGTLLASFTENSLWSSAATGTPCDSHNQGDPVVIYDQFNDHWFLTDFAFTVVANKPTAPFYQCFAVSKTSDPVAGGYWLYAVKIDTGSAGQAPAGTLGDYPHFGNWNDGCLYMASNGFPEPGGTLFSGEVFGSFNKVAMESGTVLSGSNSALGFLSGTAAFTMIPSNIVGRGVGSLPASGTPNYFVSESESSFAWEVRKFTPGATCGAGGSLGASNNVSQAVYNVANDEIVPQPAPATGSNNLDSLPDRMMQKVQYRKVGAAESLWVTHTVLTGAVGTTTGSQWAQLNVNGGTVAGSPVQEQIYTPDTTLYRWMGSIASDHVGDAALGYSTANATSPNFPSIAYSGRLVTDPLNNLPQTEIQMIAGSGSQVNTINSNPVHRWGDYTAMSVDPSDDCTFWYTNEYYDTQANGTSGNWHTRIGSFKFPTCTAPTAAAATISGRVTTSDGAPLAGVSVQLSGSQSATTITSSDGNYRFDKVGIGNFYTVVPAMADYHFAPANRSFSLVGDRTDAVFTGAPDAMVSANVIDTPEYFVRQQYLDFLGREPDQGGFDYWDAQISSCNGDSACISAKRIDVSAAFFMSPESQQTGAFVYELYAGTLGRTPTFAEFMPDRAQVIGGANLAAAKTSFADGFVQRGEFAAKYPQTITRDQFVDALLQTMNARSGADSSSLRGTLINDYDSGVTQNQSRSLVVSDAVQASAFAQAEYNRAFVLMEYFAYLRRDPEVNGYNFWLNALNSAPNNYRGMVCSFITSAEYQRRFGAVITHSNAECGP